MALEDANVFLGGPADVVNNIVCFTALTDNQKGPIYTDVIDKGSGPDLRLE